MIDIHCHLLSGLDDGAPSFEVSIEMAESAVADGVTHVVATPHSSSAWAFQPEIIQQRREELQSRVGDRLQLMTGCDFHMSYENLQDIRSHLTKYTINQKNYLLVEFADFSIPASMDQALHDLQLAGLRPIITHPERNPLIRAQSGRLLTWLRQGCYAQVTAQSLLGKFGERAQEAAETWIDADLFHFVASDAHNTTTRPLRLKEAYQWVAARKGENVAKSLFEENPRAAIEGQPLPYVPELPEGDETALGSRSSRHKRFWFF